jgi:hypothetical protein
VLVLVAVAVVGAGSAFSVSIGTSLARREAERQLLDAGLAFQVALRSYAGPGATRGGPASLDDLLKDPRAPGLRRHLRRIPHDPLTGRAEWGVVRDAQGGIVGVYSLASTRPIQQDNFPAVLQGFEGADAYRQWVFGLPAAAASGRRVTTSMVNSATPAMATSSVVNPAWRTMGPISQTAPELAPSATASRMPDTRERMLSST